jgi:hypothetical protein
MSEAHEQESVWPEQGSATHIGASCTPPSFWRQTLPAGQGVPHGLPPELELAPELPVLALEVVLVLPFELVVLAAELAVVEPVAVLVPVGPAVV